MRTLLGLIFLIFLGVQSSEISACNKNKVNSIKMERTACFGRCPWYIVEIFEDGRVTYLGKKDAPRQGYYEGKISSAKAKELFKRFDKNNILSAENEYDKKISDVPKLHFDMTFGKEKKAKKIRQANFGPAYLITLSDAVDKALDGVEWKSAIDEDLQ